MRVLHIGKYYPPFSGGIENFLGDLLPAQKEIGIHAGALVHNHVRPTLLSRNRENQGSRFIQSFSKLNVWRVPCYGSLLYTPISPRFPLWLNQVVGEFKPDILHFHLPNVSAFWAMALPSARRIPWVAHWHADVVASKIDRRLSFAYKFYRPFEQKILSLSQAVIATSPPYLESSLALANWKEKSKVVPLGLNPARLQLSQNGLKQWANNLWGDAEFKVLSVGRLTYYKGHEFLAKAIKSLDNIKVLIVGDGEQRDKLEKLVSSLGIENKVSVLGGQSEQELNALMESCDCLCLPSIERTEAFGLVLLEAMRYGKSVIASDIPGSGVGWVVNHKETGLLVEPGNVSELAGALTDMQGNQEMRHQMGKAGADRFEKYFHIKNVAQKIKEIYSNLIT